MNEQCIEWRGLRFSTGYGRLTNSEYVRTGHLYAHRWAYTHFHGPIPAGLFVLHMCDNPPCVNPAHLRCGTPRDNIRDASAKGRLASVQRSAELSDLLERSPARSLLAEERKSLMTCLSDRLKWLAISVALAAIYAALTVLPKRHVFTPCTETGDGHNFTCELLCTICGKPAEAHS